jgi:hypothetical protein
MVRRTPSDRYSCETVESLPVFRIIRCNTIVPKPFRSESLKPLQRDVCRCLCDERGARQRMEQCKWALGSASRRDADLLFNGMMPPGGSANIPDCLSALSGTRLLACLIVAPQRGCPPARLRVSRGSGGWACTRLGLPRTIRREGGNDTRISCCAAHAVPASDDGRVDASHDW